MGKEHDCPAYLMSSCIYVITGTCGCRWSDGKSGKMVRDEEMEAGGDE